MTVNPSDGDRRITSGGLRGRRREAGLIVRLQRREEGRRAVRQKQLDETN